MSTPVRIYEYATCSTCRKAVAWLKAKKIDFTAHPIVSETPSATELKSWIAKSGLPAKKWFNASGQSYRALIAEKGKDYVQGLTDDAIVKLLASDGKMIKRPILVAPKSVLIGFDEQAYAAALAVK